MKEIDISKTINEMVENFYEKTNQALQNTDYSKYTPQIVNDYKTFLVTAINCGLISNLEDLNLFIVNKVEYSDGYAYAGWNSRNLSLFKRFFVERTDEERRNVIFHELIHSLINKFLSSINNDYRFVNFIHFEENINVLLTNEQIKAIRDKFNDIFTNPYYNRNENMVFEAMQSFNEFTTQYLAEILCAMSYERKMKAPQYFSSKIFTENHGFVSDFCTYPEYEEIFLNFLRTINGFGNIDNNNELFNKWFSMIKDGSIWNQIICTYKSKGNINILFDFLISYGALRCAKESSMGIGIEYRGDKEKLTRSIQELDEKLKKLRNYDPEIVFDYEEYHQVQREVIRLGLKK